MRRTTNPRLLGELTVRVSKTNTLIGEQHSYRNDREEPLTKRYAEEKFNPVKIQNLFLKTKYQPDIENISKEEKHVFNIN